MRRNLCLLDPLGKVLILFGAYMLIPGFFGLVHHGGLHVHVLGFWLPGILCIILGLLCWLVGRGRGEQFKLRHASLMVLIIWLVLPAIGAYPLLEFTDGEFADAYFESVSGLTASGATILSGIDSLPDEIKLWRGMLSWLGGLGLIVLAVAILPNLGIGGRQMMRSEITGPLKDYDLTPQITQTAKGLWLVYTVLTLLCMLAYWAFGMGWLDAVVHSFTTMALGGFSNHDASFGYFDSPALETVAILFMLIAGFNFATHFSAFIDMRQGFISGADKSWTPLVPLGRWIRAYRRDLELLPYLGILLIGSAAVCLGVWLSSDDLAVATAIRQGIFNTVSIATTTGYSSTDFGQWPLGLGFGILLLANFASCSGSTGGGIKMVRALTLIRCLRVEQTKLLHPSAFLQIKFKNRVIPQEVVTSILAFILIYLLTILMMTLMLLAVQPGLDMLTALSAAMACISNTGPGLGEVGPATTYALLNDAATYIGALAMLLGRLEVLLFLLLLSRRLWN